ncbi:MAG TPA: DNA double-strand break repair nuclease NurA [Candidatus Caldiarchaeum subterraneum]|uniref:DNA double-strand break repair nuclease NurA n=1 Tax=Caldiarchaeum subterraneum TaxID=311458 RepID=A0A832ZX04_CALS0|nr:DNA double-strand break repair nuclease NurA [Aigarchaeota archaeon]HIQ29887.1 DNA double-strand break repair nuclease NurA [Candidatus Caldarchaeum subterraneum]
MIEPQFAHQSLQQYNIEEVLKAFSQVARVSGLASPSPLYSEVGVEAGDDWDLEPNLSLDGLSPITLFYENGVRRKVVACDTSTIKLAEGPFGGVWAIRGAVVEREGDGINLSIYGPFIYLLSPNSVSRIIKLLKNSLGLHDFSIPSMDVAHRVVAGLFEKLLQQHVASKLDKGILLVDGSLTAGPIDSPIKAVSNVIRKSKHYGSGVIAFAKSSKLRLLGQRITSIANGCEPPYLISFRGGIRMKPNHHILGEVYVAHLSKVFFPFRIDVASRDDKNPVRLVEDLLKSDSLVYGYPETLILAHQYSTFNRIDILSMQSSIETATNHKIINHPDIRESLFAPLDNG